MDIFTERTRLMSILNRHVREEDKILSDNEFIRAVLKRYEADRQLPLIDPAE